MTVKDRLIKYIKHKGVSQGRFEKDCGLSNGYINNIRKSISQDKIDLIKSSGKYDDLNFSWLLLGEGDMLTGSRIMEETVSYGMSLDFDREVEELKREVSFLKSQLESEREKNALKDQLIEMLKSSDESSKRKVKKNATNIP